MRPLIKPRSIAIIGASPKTSSFGYRTYANLKSSDAKLYLVNAGKAEIDGNKTYASARDLPEEPDCAVIAVPREAVEGVVVECAQVGIKGAIIYASGYAETGKPEHAALQVSLARIARESGMRILGPNCMGILSDSGKLRLTFADPPGLRNAGKAAIGLVSQSGGLGFALAQSTEHGHAFSHVLTAGNSCDVDVADQIAFLVNQPECNVIACLFEGMPEPRRLMQAGELAWRAGKTVIVHKIATGLEGMEAAKSHTGSLAGSNEVYRAAFDRCGFVEVQNFEALIETAAFFAKAGRPSSEGVAALSTSGGASIMVADKAEIHGVSLPQPSDAVTSILRSHIPEFGSARNPCDVTAQILSNPQSMPACAHAMLECDQYSTLIITHPFAYAPGTARLQAVAEVGRECNKPICCVWLAQWLNGPGSEEVEASPHMALFRSMDRCMETIKAWHLLERRRQSGDVSNPRLSDIGAKAQGADLLAKPGASIITEGDSKRLLSAYGVAVVPEMLVQEAAGAIRAARELGYPVAVKVESPDIPHKTEAGGVKLNLQDEQEVTAAVVEILRDVNRTSPNARITGLLVQPMIKRDLELIVGAKRDPLFGPVLVVGLGGILVELLRDSVVALAPVSKQQAVRMIDSLRGRPLLNGFRGSQSVDIDLLASTISRISELVMDHASSIVELDVNPLVISDGRIIAVDALISRAASHPGGSASERVMTA
jgi:acyl-CoA synthetase (NDP forming)